MAVRAYNYANYTCRVDAFRKRITGGDERRAMFTWKSPDIASLRRRNASLRKNLENPTAS